MRSTSTSKNNQRTTSASSRGLAAEEARSAERLFEHRVGEVRGADEGRELVELLEKRRGVGRGVGEAIVQAGRTSSGRP